MHRRSLILLVLITSLPAVSVLGIATISYLRPPLETADAGQSSSLQLSGAGSNDEMKATLSEYTRSGGSKGTTPAAAATNDLLPDVNTMIERLATRLKASPEDAKGWQMLGWSYFHTARYKEATAAYAKAIELDPNSAELKTSYAEANAKGAEVNSASAKIGGGSNSAKNSTSEVRPPADSDAAVRAMVDGLANRLANSPRDPDGWARLMRSRAVLGERGAAAEALRNALEIFKEDPAAAKRITAAALELGLNVR